MTDDRQLLREFAQEGSEAAFNELVSRHIDLVYVAARRVVNGDAHLAQDVTQSVFIDLARKAGRLPEDVVLAGWLHRHTCYRASTAVRTERRRKNREQAAMEMRSLDDNTEPPWSKIAPYIDDSLNKLRPADRDALVLRFLKQQDFRAVGAALRVSEDAAQKRVSRALEKLRHILGRRGVAFTAAALGAILSAQAAKAAPTGLAAQVATASLASGAKTGTALTILKLMASTKLRTTGVSAIILASLLTPFAVEHHAQARILDQQAALRRQASQLVQLQQEHARLAALSAAPDARGTQTVADAASKEILRLRGEIGQLELQLRELTETETNRPLSREEALDSMRQLYQGRINALKQRFADNPAAAVPELQYLSDRKWLELVAYDHHIIDPDGSIGMSSARGSAQIEFGDTVLWDALRKYRKDNDNQFPTDLSQLTPYFKTPVDESVLQDWVILPTSSLPEALQVDGAWAITQKAPVDAEHDQRIVIGARQTRLGFDGAKQWAVSGTGGQQ